MRRRQSSVGLRNEHNRICDQGDVPYAIDFLNPAPDFERDRITSYYFEMVLDKMSKLVIDRALHGAPSNPWPRWKRCSESERRKDLRERQRRRRKRRARKRRARTSRQLCQIRQEDEQRNVTDGKCEGSRGALARVAEAADRGVAQIHGTVL